MDKDLVKAENVKSCSKTVHDLPLPDRLKQMPINSDTLLPKAPLPGRVNVADFFLSFSSDVGVSYFGGLGFRV